MLMFFSAGSAASLLIGLLDGLRLLRLLLDSSFLKPSLRFVNSRVYYGVSLSDKLNGARLFATQTLLVYIFDIVGRLQSRLSLSIDCFFDNLGPTL